MSDDFYVGYGPVPDVDRRFLVKCISVGMIGLGFSGGYIASRAASEGGGRWETGTLVTLQGRLGFHPHPILWHAGQATVLAGIGKHGIDPHVAGLAGQTVQARGMRIVRGECAMLGVHASDIEPFQINEPALPPAQDEGMVSLSGEIVDAQCFMGVMNPGYGRTHRGCATQCVRGGQPVYFAPGNQTGTDHKGCGDIGLLLCGARGQKINQLVLTHVARPVIMHGRMERLGNMRRLLMESVTLMTRRRA